MSFAETAAQAVGKTKRTIERAAARGKALGEVLEGLISERQFVATVTTSFTSAAAKDRKSQGFVGRLDEIKREEVLFQVETKAHQPKGGDRADLSPTLHQAMSAVAGYG